MIFGGRTYAKGEAGEVTVFEEAEVVYAWRLEQLAAAGFGPVDAELIASSPVAYHDAVELVRNGCPHSTARAILV